MLIRSENLNLRHIAESGQCFRMNKIAEDRYSLIALGEYVELLQVDENKIQIFGTSTDNLSMWEEYFDLNYDYSEVINELIDGKDEFLRKAAVFGRGLRILRQEPFETLISFIISQNKNIPAIKSAIEKLCRAYGEKKCRSVDTSITYYAFPSATALADATLKDLRALGLGYRDEYVLKTAQAVAEGRPDLLKLMDMDSERLMQELMSLRGVGVKVANCVALFGFHKLQCVPVDVWIARILKQVYKGEFSWEPYGDRAGLVQQYMFYYMRNGK
ncbi:MAG: DNA glycosylase [Anaerovoracaceae bacterium]